MTDLLLGIVRLRYALVLTTDRETLDWLNYALDLAAGSSSRDDIAVYHDALRLVASGPIGLPDEVAEGRAIVGLLDRIPLNKKAVVPALGSALIRYISVNATNPDPIIHEVVQKTAERSLGLPLADRKRLNDALNRVRAAKNFNRNKELQARTRSMRDLLDDRKKWIKVDVAPPPVTQQSTT